jgi:LPXTG-motif cell wall-anchored protein
MMPHPALSHRLYGPVVVGCIAVVLAGVGPSRSIAAASPTLSVSGSIDVLYPGFTGQLSVRVSNPFDYFISLTTLTTTTEPVAAGCELHLTIGRLTGHPIVPAYADVDVELLVSFDRDAPDACQGVSIPLKFTVDAAAVTIDAAPDAVLPRSGSNSTNLISVAATALALGAGMILLARRRQS